MRRNRERLERAREAVAVGKISGAVGTFALLDPAVEEKVCARLGLTAAAVSTQIIQRDRYAEYLSTLAIIASSLDKFALNVRHWQRTEVNEAQERFAAGQKGSSAMPHKRNPITSERICGLARVVRANSLVGLENVALWHERDISHSSAERVVLPDSSIGLDYMLHKAISLIDGWWFTRSGCSKHSIDARLSSAANSCWHSRRKASRATAYEWVQRNAMKVWDGKQNFQELLKDDTTSRRSLGGGDR